MIRVEMPANFEAERRYVLGVLLGEFLGLPFEVVIKPGVTGTYFGVSGRNRLFLPDDLFSIKQDDWLTESILPTDAAIFPLSSLPFFSNLQPRIESLCLPRWLSGQSSQGVFECFDGLIKINADLLGAGFFFLSRCEEYVATFLDQHQRFPSSASFAARHGLLSRAPVNEYVEVLWAALRFIAPGLERQQRSFRQLVSHDVDIPFDLLFNPPKRFARSLAGDVLKRRKPELAVQRAMRWSKVRRGDWVADPYNTFEWIWRQSEKRGLQSAFYFMAGRTNTARDSDYEIEHPAIRGLIRASAERGHEIGLHPSYESYCRPEIIGQEFDRLRRVCEEEGVRQARWGGRHHFLRWSARETARHWERAGLAYDSTLGFADQIGFRCGTCYEFPVFDLADRRTLSLRERPLLVMEVSLVSPEYMGLANSEEALERVSEIKKVCRQFSGDFTLLWHNDRLASLDFKDMYLECLDN